jgi:predicted DNA-binding protein (UPF0251 family)
MFILHNIIYRKKLQCTSTCIEITMKEVESIMLYFEKYRNENFASSMNIAKSLAIDIWV